VLLELNSHFFICSRPTRRSTTQNVGEYAKFVQEVIFHKFELVAGYRTSKILAWFRTTKFVSPHVQLGFVALPNLGRFIAINSSPEAWNVILGLLHGDFQAVDQFLLLRYGEGALRIRRLGSLDLIAETSVRSWIQFRSHS